MATIAFDVYHYFMREAGDSTDAWLISGNPFDVIGAVSAGMKSAWQCRGQAMCRSLPRVANRKSRALISQASSVRTS